MSKIPASIMIENCGLGKSSFLKERSALLLNWRCFGLPIFHRNCISTSAIFVDPKKGPDN